MKKLWFILVSIFISTCSVAFATDWQTNPPVDTHKYYYALGYGKSMKEAKNDALSMVSAKISSSVSSNFSNSVTANRQGDSEEIISSAKSEVMSKSKEIEYSNVKLLQSYNDKSEWIVLVEVDRKVLVDNYQRELDKLDEKIKIEWDLFEHTESFQKLKYSSVIEHYLKETDNIFPILYALNPKYDDSNYKARYSKYTKDMKEAKSKLVFKIKSDENSLSLASLVKSELSKQNAVFNKKTYNTLIYIDTKARQRRYKSTNAVFARQVFALRTTTIKVFDRDKNEVSSVIYKTKSGSSEGFKDAISRTAKYQDMIDKNGIISFIVGE